MVAKIGRIVFGLVSFVAVGAATWFTWKLTHESLGPLGGALAAVAAAMVSGAPFLIAWAALWGSRAGETASDARAGSRR